ncbi:18384_t:CDS:2, partial [Entrophospora sp. SA101]
VTRAIGTATNAIKGQIENTADKVREVIKDHPLASLAVASVATAVTQATANRFIEEEHITAGSVIYQAIEDDPWVQKNELKNIIERAVSFVNNNNTRGSSRHTTLLEILPEFEGETQEKHVSALPAFILRGRK